MIKKGIAKIFLGGVLVALMLLLGSQNTMAQRVTGAIFTTLANGSSVNANVYDNREEVYLNGGPYPNRSCASAGLPDDYYYFQVTDPSGSTLLSDYGGKNGTIRVSGGVISDYTGDHGMGAGQCRDVTVQLFPYDPTPNPGGEYKVWMTRVDDYDPLLGGSFGFLPSKSKTDNFKVIGDGDGEGDGEKDGE